MPPCCAVLCRTAPGITLAVLGCPVVLTDLEDNLPLLRKNVAANGGCGAVRRGVSEGCSEGCAARGWGHAGY